MTLARLIDSSDASTLLVAAIAAQPAGAKLSIPQLRDALVNQGDVLDLIKRLVDEGTLERATLRPVPCGEPIHANPSSQERKVPLGDRRFREDREPRDNSGGAALLGEIEAFCARTGMFVSRFGFEAVNDFGLVNSLRKGRVPSERTAAKVRAFIAEHEVQQSPEPPQPRAAEEPVATLPPPPAPDAPKSETISIAPTPFELSRAINMFLDGTGITPTAFGKAVNGDTALVKGIRNGRMPRRKTVEKIRAIILDPPAGLLEARYRESRIKLPRPDPTQKPATPLMDVADRQRINAQRHSAAIRRGEEAAAARKLDAGERPKNSFERTVMARVEQRRADEARQADPVEQAKLALQRKGRSVYDASVAGGKKGRFHVSGERDGNGRLKELTPAELIDLAERKTGQQFRRVA